MFARLGLPMNHYTIFVLPSENQNAFARSADLEFQLTDSRIYPLNSLRSQGSFLENAPLYKC